MCWFPECDPADRRRLETKLPNQARYQRRAKTFRVQQNSIHVKEYAADLASAPVRSRGLAAGGAQQLNGLGVMIVKTTAITTEE